MTEFGWMGARLWRRSFPWALAGCLSLGLLGGCKRDPAQPPTPQGGGAAAPPSPRLAPGVLAAEIQQGIGPLLGYFPSSLPALALIPRLGDLPPTLESALSRLEAIFKAKGQPNELRPLVLSLQQEIGVNPLALESFTSNGFDPKAGLVATRLSLKQRGVTVAALRVLAPAKVQALLERLAKQKLLVTEVKTKQVKGTEIRTAYRKNLFGQPSEEIAWAFRGNDLLLAIDRNRQGVPDPEAPPIYTEDHAQALESLLNQSPDSSLQTSKTLQHALQRIEERSLFLLFSPLQGLASAARPPSPPPSRTLPSPSPLAGLSRRNLRLSSFLSQISQSSSSAQWAISSLAFHAGTLQLSAFLALDPPTLLQIQRFLPTSGDLGSLHQSLHKDAIFTIKAALKADTLLQTADEVAKRAGLPLERAFHAIQKLTGLDLPKEVLPLVAGHGFLTLYRIAPNLPEIQKNPNPFFLPQYLDLALTAQTTDPAKLQTLLGTLAKTFRYQNLSIQSETLGSHTLYSIAAWPNAKAYWTVSGNLFIYSIGRAALDKTLAALRSPNERFDLSAFASTMQAPSSGAFLLYGPRLRKTIYEIQLPMAVRLIIGQAVQQLELLDTLILSASPHPQGLKLQGTLRLTQP